MSLVGSQFLKINSSTTKNFYFIVHSLLDGLNLEMLKTKKPINKLKKYSTRNNHITYKTSSKSIITNP
jgi:hypothetical protein